MKSIYKKYEKEDRLKIAKKMVEEDVIKSIVKSNRNTISTSKDLGVNEEELIKHRDKVIKGKFGIK